MEASGASQLAGIACLMAIARRQARARPTAVFPSSPTLALPRSPADGDQMALLEAEIAVSGM